MGGIVTNAKRRKLPPPLRGRIEVGGSDTPFHGFEDALCNSLGIRQDVIVPEPQDAIALSFQPAATLFVVRDLLRMLPAIHFDDQPMFETDKIHDERADRLLASKLRGSDLTALELLPQPPFCVRWVIAQLPRAFGIHPPIPAFPRKGGR